MFNTQLSDSFTHGSILMQFFYLKHFIFMRPFLHLLEIKTKSNNCILLRLPAIYYSSVQWSKQDLADDSLPLQMSLLTMSLGSGFYLSLMLPNVRLEPGRVSKAVGIFFSFSFSFLNADFVQFIERRGFAVRHSWGDFQICHTPTICF